MPPVKRSLYPFGGFGVMQFPWRRCAYALCSVFMVAALPAQKPLSQRTAEALQTEQYLRSRYYGSPREEELRRQAEWSQSDLVRKANKFALLWVQFTAEENAGHTFDVKLAKKLEKAFNDLKEAHGWPAK